jgi:hypothetical protein
MQFHRLILRVIKWVDRKKKYIPVDGKQSSLLLLA